MNEASVEVAALRIGADPAGWRELGFDVSAGSSANVGGVRLDLDRSAEPGAIVAWSLQGVGIPDSIDGLRTETGARDGSGGAHPNGVLGIDHLVVLTPSLERTTRALGEIGVDCRRVREADGVRQGFFLLGDLLVEVVEGPGTGSDEPARFWGITMVVSSIDAAADLLGERLGRVKDAVQPGRRIATVRAAASGGVPLALITPRDRRPRSGPAS